VKPTVEHLFNDTRAVAEVVYCRMRHGRMIMNWEECGIGCVVFPGSFSVEFAWRKGGKS
jgi:hypothetical protein